MKLIHCADIHLDSKMESNLTKEKAKERKSEILVSFKNMVKFAADNEVEVIIIAGDMFDTGRVSKNTRETVTACIKENPEIDFLYLSGNHDSDNFVSDLIEKPINLKSFKESWTEYYYNNLVISGVELSLENSNRVYTSLNLNKDVLNIVVMHGQESKYADVNKGDIVNLSELKNKNIDYLALGHIHSYKLDKLDERGMYAYSGCFEGRGFDECGEKGFVLLTIEKDKIISEFKPFARRKFYELPVDISGLSNTYEIKKNIDAATAGISDDSLVKIVLTGKVEMDCTIDITHLLKEITNFFFVKIYDKTRLLIKPELFRNDISLKGEFIRKVMADNYSEEDRDRIILFGIKALSGEEID